MGHIPIGQIFNFRLITFLLFDVQITFSTTKYFIAIQKGKDIHRNL